MCAALIALSGLPLDDAEARQASQPGTGAAAHAPAPAQPPAAATPHVAPAPETPVEAGHGAAPPAQPAPGAAADHAVPAGPAAAESAHAQPPAHGPPAEGAHDAGAHGAAGGQEHGGAGHESSIWETIARLFNFAVLAGGLFYFLRAPLAQYLANRDQQIRGGLLSARETSDRANAQLAEIDRRLEALPAEIEALRARGVAEIAAEEKRIQAEAEAERRRLLEDMQRDVDMRVRVARKMLTERAADLAVTLAAQRVKETITDADQQRLIDSYASQVKDIHG